MILPLADTLQNCLQNLTSRIAGIDNEQMANRAIGMGSMLGFGLGAIKEQFKTPNSNINTQNGNESNAGGFGGFISRAKSLITPQMNLSSEKDYNGNDNPIRNVMQKEKSNNKNILSNINKNKVKGFASFGAKAGINTAKNYLKIGAAMAEGNFNVNNKSFNSTSKHMKEFNTTEFTNNTSELKTNNNLDEKGEKNES